MKLKIKIKIKYILYYLLGVATLLVILFIAYIKDRLLETSIIIVLFYIYRHLFEKQFHASSLWLCSFISIIVFIVVVNLEVNISISVFISIILTFIVTLVSYYVRDYLDTKILVNSYKEKLFKLNSKALENLTEDEMISLMPSIKYEIIHIVYEYLHRDKSSLTASGFAYRNNISEATLYRYVKQVKNKYESLGLNS